VSLGTVKLYVCQRPASPVLRLDQSSAHLCSPPPPIAPLLQFPWRLTCATQGFTDYEGNTWVGRDVTVPLLRPIATSAATNTPYTTTPGVRFRGIETMFNSQCTGIDSLSLSLQVPSGLDLAVTLYFTKNDVCVPTLLISMFESKIVCLNECMSAAKLNSQLSTLCKYPQLFWAVAPGFTDAFYGIRLFSSLLGIALGFLFSRFTICAKILLYCSAHWKF
jgi:hypothetical protein